MSDCSSGDSSDESLLKTSIADGSIRHDFSRSTSPARHSAESLSWPISGVLERRKSGSVVLTMGLFATPSEYKSASRLIQFKSGNSGAQFGATLERFAADITPAAKKSAAMPSRSKVRFTLDDEENEFEVEKILQYKNGQYLVKWKGYLETENTWEPAANLANCQQKLREFERSDRLPRD